MKNRTILTPIIVGAALVLLMAIIAKTDLFQPLIHFIHTGKITILEALWCVLASVAAFALTLKLLIMLGEYFLPQAEKRRQQENNEKKDRADG